MKNKNILARLRKRWTNESGQSTTEYILILAIVVMLASKVRTTLTSKVMGSMNVIDTEMNKFQNSDN